MINTLYRHKKITPSLLFHMIAVTGLLLIVSEWLATTKSCGTAGGCSTVRNFALNDHVFLAVGAGAFLLVLILDTVKYLPFRHQILNAVLFSALVVEGYLVAFQVLIIKTICRFCITIAILWGILGILYFLKNKNPSGLISSLVASGAVFGAVFLLNPYSNDSNKILSDLKEGDMVLVYSTSCNYCKEVLEYCQNYGISVKLTNIEQIYPLCSLLGITRVPALIYQSYNQRTILTGKDTILDYFGYFQKFNNTSTKIESYPSFEDHKGCSINNHVTGACEIFN